MDCCLRLTPEEKEQRRQNRNIEKGIKEEMKNFSKEVKLLLLGTGESGKSTFIKQMRLIHNKGFTDKEKRAQVKFVYQNLITAMKSMIKAMVVLNIKYDKSPEITDCIQKIMCINADNVNFNNLNANALKKLWEFEGIQETYRNRRRYQLFDSTEYFFLNIDRVSSPKYLPNDEDMLRVRVQTNGVQEYDFKSKEYNIRITDIAGQRSKREKWLNLFDKCTAMIFISAISEYDQVLMENNNVNRLQESLELFGAIINHHIFRDKASVLFLNKIDILEDKIKTSNLADYFPDYDGQPGDAMAARDFIKKMFVHQKKDKIGYIYANFTCATDKDNIKKVFSSVQDAIMENNLKESGVKN